MAEEGEFPEVVAEARPKTGTTESLTIPGIVFTSMSAVALVANTLYYFPFLVRTPITVTGMTIEVTIAATGKAVRVGIYRADKDWQPTSLVSDAGVLSVNGVAVVSFTGLSISLQEGRYLIALHSESNPTLRFARGSILYFSPSVTAGALLSALTVSKTYAVLANPGTAWDTATYSTATFLFYVFLTITP